MSNDLGRKTVSSAEVTILEEDTASICIESSIVPTKTINEYTMTISIWGKQTSTYNEYGQRIYAHIGNNKVLIDEIKLYRVEDGTTKRTFTYTFTVNEDTQCHASTICVVCEDHAHPSSILHEFTAQSASEKAEYKALSVASKVMCSNTYVSSEKKYIAEDKINLSMTKDLINQNIRYRIYLAYQKPDTPWSEYTMILNSKDVNSVEHIITSYPRGTRFSAYSEIYDTEYSYTSTNQVILDNIYRNRTPGRVTNINPATDTIFAGDNFKIEWDATTDPDGQALTYDLLLSNDNGQSYHIAATDLTQTYYIYDISSDSEGTTYKFKVRANDSMVTGTETVSPLYRKNTKPTVPTYVFPSSGYYIDDVTITWNASIDPDLLGISHYSVYINDKLIADNVTNTFYQWHIPEADPDGTQYVASIVAHDKSGTTSDKGYAIGGFKKALSIVPPQAINPTITYHENNIPLTWSAVLGVGSNMTYLIEYKINDGVWTYLATTSYTYYTHDITKIERNSSIQYRIKCRTSSGKESEYKESIVYYRNETPTKPMIQYPVNNGTVYDTSLRLAINVPSKDTDQKMTLYVNCNGKLYNSVKHPSMFSISGTYSNSTSLVFTSENLKIGQNSISIYTNDGLLDSPPSSYNYTIKNSEVSVKQGDSITEKLFTTLMDKINTVRIAYALAPYYFSLPVKKDSLIKWTYIEDLRNAVIEARHLINNFDAQAIDDLKTEWSTANGIGTPMKADYIQEIIDIINHI